MCFKKSSICFIFQIEGRYPDYRFTIYQTFDEQRTKLILAEAKIFYQWLRNKLP